MQLVGNGAVRPGVNRYFRNYLIHQAVDQVRSSLDAPLMVSSAKAVNQRLRERSEQTEVTSENFPVLLNEVLTEEIEGYSGDLLDQGKASPFYQQKHADFTKLMTEDDLLPVSPYDSLWQSRSTMREAGHGLRYVRGSDIEQLTAGELSQIHRYRGDELQLMGPDAEGVLREQGAALSLEDKSGLTELSSRMSVEEYRAVRSHVLSVGEENFMSAAATQRAAAVLDELGSQGVEYEVSADRQRGQIKVRPSGTKMDIRLMDTAANEHFAGARVYDDGVETYFHAQNGQNRTEPYTPTPAEAVALIRVAQGKPVQRWDDSGEQIGAVGTHTRETGRGRRQMQNTYSPVANGQNSSAMTMVAGDLMMVNEAGSRVPRSGQQALIYRSAKNKSLPRAFPGRSGDGRLGPQTPQEQAGQWLAETVSTARDRFSAALRAEELIDDFETHRDEALAGEYSPEFSGSTEIAEIQRSYWNVLTGDSEALLKPGVDDEDYRSAVESIDERSDLSDEGKRIALAELGEYAFIGGSGADKVRIHAQTAADEMIGEVDGGAVSRMNAVRTAQHMTSEKGYWGNRNDIVAALRTTGEQSPELMGQGPHSVSLRDQLVTFDQTSARDRSAVEDPFIASMMDTVSDTLSRSGARPEAVSIDDNGVIRYEATRIRGARNASEESFIGHIGQVFPRGEHGEVVTEFASGENFMMVPGYLGRIEAQRPGADLSVEERTRLRGFEQVMAERIEHQVSTDVLNSRSEVGDPSGLNGVYRGLYDTRYPVDYISQQLEQGMTAQQVGAVLETQSARVRYSRDYQNGSTLFAEWAAQNSFEGPDMTNDNFDSPWVRTGGRNMAIMTEASDGYFDPVMTNGAVGQGTVRFLVPSAEVDDEGRIIRGDADDRAALRQLPEMASTEFDPYDRQQMTASNYLNASAVVPKTRTAMMTFGGWTFDDPVVVSKSFAEQNPVRGADDQLRSLIAGDKVSDFHGNKGVVSLVVDPQMDAAEADAQGLSEPVAVFRDNPELDVVMSPFSAASRFNGGTARELLENPQDLMMNGEQISGGIGEMNLIVTHKDVESGTRVYDAPGEGRKASAQLAWALGSQGCEKVMAEFYGSNDQAAANLREVLITQGMDMEDDGTLRASWREDAQRHVFAQPELQRREPTGEQQIGTLNTTKMRQQFAEAIDERGGVMEIPFPVKLPNGELTPASDVTEGTYQLPVLSASLRSGQELDDGVFAAHDHTRQYLKIADASAKYRDAQQRLETSALGAKPAQKWEADMHRARGQVAGAYRSITDDLQRRELTGKSNLFKEGLMSSRQPNSATAVWTADPRLDIDQLGMGTAMAESMGITDDDYVVVWRDPVLRDSGVRYMRAQVDDRLAGVSISPVMDKSFDGDFDGDSVGVVKLGTQEAQAEAMDKLSVEANLLDLGSVNEEGFHPLNIQDSLDVKVAQHHHPELAERFAEFTVKANDIQQDWVEGRLSDDGRLDANRELTAGLSDYYREAFSGEYGTGLRFDSEQSHLSSVVEACVDTKAKGSEAKVSNYARYFGAEIDFSAGDQPASQRLCVNEVHDRSLHTREEEQGSMRAVAVKTFGTGVAGAFSQRGVKALRNQELSAVLEMTYPVTQSVLQSKHDPAEADLKYSAMMGPARSLWRGEQLRQSPDMQWETVRDDAGRAVQADKELWTEQFQQFYSSPTGLNIKDLNTANISRVAEALSDPATGQMLGVEEPEALSSREQGAALMDRMAYGGTMDLLTEAAQQNQNIFDGKLNGHFAPRSVQRSQQLTAQMEDAQRLDLPMMAEEIEQQQAQSRSVGASDVLADSYQQAAVSKNGSRSRHAVAARLPRTAAPVPVVEPAAAQAGDDFQP